MPEFFQRFFHRSLENAHPFPISPTMFQKCASLPRTRNLAKIFLKRFENVAPDAVHLTLFELLVVFCQQIATNTVLSSNVVICRQSRPSASYCKDFRVSRNSECHRFCWYILSAWVCVKTSLLTRAFLVCSSTQKYSCKEICAVLLSKMCSWQMDNISLKQCNF